MALGIQVTRVLPLYPRGTFLQWDLSDPVEAGDYTFDIYRSGSPEGPWTELLIQTENRYNYSDLMPSVSTPAVEEVNQLSLTRGIFYRIVVTSPSLLSRAEVVTPVEPRLDGRQKMLKRKFLPASCSGVSTAWRSPLSNECVGVLAVLAAGMRRRRL